MPKSTSTLLSAYGVSVLAIAIAIAIRAALTPWMGQAFPLATMFTAVAFVVWYGGWGPALVTALAGWIAAGLIFGRPDMIGQGSGLPTAVNLGVYLVSTGSIILLGEAMRAAQRRLQQGQENLSSTNLALENQVEAQSLLAAIVASSDDAIISKTLDGRITSWNKGAERLFGFTAGEAIGSPIHIIIPAELRDQERDILERLRRGERIDHLDVVRMRKDGTRVNVSVTISPVRDRHGRIIGASKTARDITARTEWERESARSARALREHSEALTFAMAAGRMGAWSRDLKADTVWWSPELALLFGLPADTDYRRDRVFELMTEEDRKRLPALIDAALASKKDYVAEFRFRHAQTGEWRWMEVRGRAQYDADGRPVMLHGLGIDITERRRAVEALQEADRRKDEFLATLAHELRNPLAPISSGLHILKSAGTDSPAGKTSREIMERQVAQMVRLVDDLLDVARITTGKVELRTERLDLAAAVRDAAETSRPLFELAGQPLTIDIPDRPIYVHADRTRLAQVFANLLNNSLKFSDPGQPIGISLAREGGRAVVRVRDSGAGIHADMLPRIFEMFRQADSTGGRSRGGLGIGLSLVKRIVEMHGGTVEASSPGLGQGSEFVIRIPALDVAVMPPSGDPPAPPTLTRRRILVVDDNADAAESLAQLLTICGHETRLAHDGSEAVREAAAFHPDVVFLDIGMPTLDGHETARRIRQEPWGKNMVLVALTGWGQVEDRRRSREAGFNHHLVKPADPAMVTRLLASLGTA